MVHLHHWLDRSDAVGGLQGHQLVVDAVVELLVVLVKGKLTQAEQGPTLVDRCHVRLCQYLLGIFQTGFLILTVVGNLHQLLQVVAGTLLREVTVTELHSFQESFFRFLIVLLLEGVHSLHMHGDVMAPEAVLLLRIFGYLIGDLRSRQVVLMGGLVNRLVTPGGVEQTFITMLMTQILEILGHFGKLFLVICTDQSQHLCLQPHQLNIVLCLYRQADQTGQHDDQKVNLLSHICPFFLLHFSRQSFIITLQRYKKNRFFFVLSNKISYLCIEFVFNLLFYDYY